MKKPGNPSNKEVKHQNTFIFHPSTPKQQEETSKLAHWEKDQLLKYDSKDWVSNVHLAVQILGMTQERSYRQGVQGKKSGDEKGYFKCREESLALWTSFFSCVVHHVTLPTTNDQLNTENCTVFFLLRP